jgi:hypothetical protein
MKRVGSERKGEGKERGREGKGGGGNKAKHSTEEGGRRVEGWTLGREREVQTKLDLGFVLSRIRFPKMEKA